MPSARRERGQTAVEYALVVAVVAVAFWSAMNLLVQDGKNSPVGNSFSNYRKTVEAPYP